MGEKILPFLPALLLHAGLAFGLYFFDGFLGEPLAQPSDPQNVVYFVDIVTAPAPVVVPEPVEETAPVEEIERPEDSLPVPPAPVVEEAEVVEPVKEQPKPKPKPKPKLKPKPKPKLKPRAQAKPIQAVIGPAPKIDQRSLPVKPAITGKTGLIKPSWPAYLRNPKPPYPKAARRRRLEGLVLLQVLVGPEGYALKVAVHRTSGYGLLDRTALETVRQWQFIPAKRNGLAVPLDVLVPVRFALDTD